MGDGSTIDSNVLDGAMQISHAKAQRRNKSPIMGSVLSEIHIESPPKQSLPNDYIDSNVHIMDKPLFNEVAYSQTLLSSI